MQYHHGQFDTFIQAGKANGVRDNNMALVGNEVRAYREKIGWSATGAAAERMKR